MVTQKSAARKTDAPAPTVKAGFVAALKIGEITHVDGRARLAARVDLSADHDGDFARNLLALNNRELHGAVTLTEGRADQPRLFASEPVVFRGVFRFRGFECTETNCVKLTLTFDLPMADARNAQAFARLGGDGVFTIDAIAKEVES